MNAVTEIIGTFLEAFHNNSSPSVTIVGDVRGCIQKFPDWPPGARTANGKALCH